MIIGIGVDIVEFSRIENLLKNYNDKFYQKILSPKEIEQFLSKGKDIKYLAGRFSVKESLIKALRGFPEGFSFSHIEVLNDEKGVPIISVSDDYLYRYPHLRNLNYHVSISHEREYVISLVVIENVSGS